MKSLERRDDVHDGIKQRSKIFVTVLEMRIRMDRLYSLSGEPLVVEMVKRNVRTARSLLYHVKEHPSDVSEPPKITTRASQGPWIRHARVSDTTPLRAASTLHTIARPRASQRPRTCVIGTSSCASRTVGGLTAKDCRPTPRWSRERSCDARRQHEVRVPMHIVCGPSHGNAPSTLPASRQRLRASLMS